MKKIDPLDYMVTDICKKTGYPVNKVMMLLSDEEAPMTPEEIIKSAESAEAISPAPHAASELVEERLSEKELEKIAPSTGIRGLDEHIKGFIPGHLYLLSGETNAGKTSVACNFAFAVASQGKRVLYLALEPDNTIIDFLASIATKKYFDDIEEKDYAAIPQGIDIYKKDRVDTQDKMIKFIEDLDRYDLIIIDHFGYFITSEYNSNQEQSNKVKQLVGLAKRKKSAVLFIQHMNKSVSAGKKKAVGKERIMGSSALYQDATEVLMVTRDHVENDQFQLSYKDTGNILIMKTKSGTSGTVKIAYHSGGATIVQGKEEFRRF
jgi:KaiC/GvpD/RAD55 family RecA-like ATPase